MILLLFKYLYNLPMLQESIKYKKYSFLVHFFVFYVGILGFIAVFSFIR